MGFLYIAQVPSGPVKLGSTTQARVRLRVSSIFFGNERAVLMASRDLSTLERGVGSRVVRTAEHILHEALSSYRITSEWYRPCRALHDLALRWGGDLWVPDEERSRIVDVVDDANLRWLPAPKPEVA